MAKCFIVNGEYTETIVDTTLEKMPKGSIEVPPPPDLYATWDGKKWKAGKKTDAEAASDIRAQRDAIIDAVQWRVQRARDEADLGVTPSEDRAALLTYVQALRDVPQQPSFPSNVTWPTDPANA